MSSSAQTGSPSFSPIQKAVNISDTKLTSSSPIHDLTDSEVATN